MGFTQSYNHQRQWCGVVTTLGLRQFGTTLGTGKILYAQFFSSSNSTSHFCKVKIIERLFAYRPW